MRSGITGHWRCGKRTWYAYGGFTNSKCWRRQTKSGWQYFVSFR